MAKPETPQFASVEDFRLVHDTDESDERLEALLNQASSLLYSEYLQRYGTYAEGKHVVFDLNAGPICIDMVWRTLVPPAGVSGATQFSETVGPFTRSATLAPEGAGCGVFLKKAERKRLGLTGVRVGSLRPRIHPEEATW